MLCTVNRCLGLSLVGFASYMVWVMVEEVFFATDSFSPTTTTPREQTTTPTLQIESLWEDGLWLDFECVPGASKQCDGGKTLSRSAVVVVAPVGLAEPSVRLFESVSERGILVTDVPGEAPFSIASAGNAVPGAPGFRWWDWGLGLHESGEQVVARWIGSSWPAYLRAFRGVRVVVAAPQTAEEVRVTWEAAVAWFHSETCWQGGRLPSRLKAEVSAWLGMALQDEGVRGMLEEEARRIWARKGKGEREEGGSGLGGGWKEEVRGGRERWRNREEIASGPGKMRIWDDRVLDCNQDKVRDALGVFSQVKTTVTPNAFLSSLSLPPDLSPAPQLLQRIATWAGVPLAEELTPLAWTLASVFHARAALSFSHSNPETSRIPLSSFMSPPPPSSLNSLAQVVCPSEDVDCSTSIQSSLQPIPQPTKECAKEPVSPLWRGDGSEKSGSEPMRVAIAFLATNAGSVSYKTMIQLVSVLESLNTYGGLFHERADKLLLHVDDVSPRFAELLAVWDVKPVQVPPITADLEEAASIYVTKFHIWLETKYDRIVVFDSDLTITTPIGHWAFLPPGRSMGVFFRAEDKYWRHGEGLVADRARKKVGVDQWKPKAPGKLVKIGEGLWDGVRFGCTHKESTCIPHPELDSRCLVDPPNSWLSHGSPQAAIVASEWIGTPVNGGAISLSPDEQAFVDLFDHVRAEYATPHNPEPLFSADEEARGSLGNYQYGPLVRSVRDEDQLGKPSTARVIAEASLQFPRRPNFLHATPYRTFWQTSDQGIYLHLSLTYRSSMVISWRDTPARLNGNPFWTHWINFHDPWRKQSHPMGHAQRLWLALFHKGLARMRDTSPSTSSLADTLHQSLRQLVKETWSEQNHVPKWPKKDLNLFVLPLQEAKEYAWDAELRKAKLEFDKSASKPFPRLITLTLVSAFSLCQRIPPDARKDAPLSSPIAQTIFQDFESWGVAAEKLLSLAATLPPPTVLSDARETLDYCLHHRIAPKQESGGGGENGKLK